MLSTDGTKASTPGPIAISAARARDLVMVDGEGGRKKRCGRESVQGRSKQLNQVVHRDMTTTTYLTYMFHKNT